MHTYLGYRVVFLKWLLNDQGYIAGDTIFMPESRFYQFVFMHNQVDEVTLKIAFDHASQKVHRFIDTYTTCQD